MQGFRYWGSRDLVSDLYLLWMGSLRLGEVEELRLEDLDTLASLSAGLAGRRLTIRHSKGLRDRTVYLTDTAVRVLEAYLAARGQGPTDHLFLYRNQALNKDLIPARIKAAGKRVGVRVYPHKLRHTHATQILNAGCQVTTIQKILGHQRLYSTMIYTRVHDRTVAEDYYATMDVVEKRLEVAPGPPCIPVIHALRLLGGGGMAGVSVGVGIAVGVLVGVCVGFGVGVTQ